MLRTLALFLLLVAVCTGVEYNISVDATGGQDVTSCRSGTIILNKVSPNVSCKTIAYALANVSTSDQLTLNLLPGTHQAADSLVFNFNRYSIMGTDSSGPKAIIDCMYNPALNGFQLTVSQSVPYMISNIAFHNCIGGTGGAINIRQGQGTAQISNCAFVNNHATANGGAIYSRASVDITRTIFTNNSAGSGAGLGGALYLEGSSCQPSVDRSTFYLNSASSGAAIYAFNVGPVASSIMYFISNNFTNNTAASNGGAFFADNAAVGNRTYDFTGSTFDNNCATNAYTDSYEVQVRCTAPCAFSNRGNSTGCTDIARNIPPPAPKSGKKSNRDRAIIIGVVVPFGILAILSIALFLYIRKRHNKEMGKRDEYRKKILKALENLPPEEQEAARLEAENADPKAPKCQLCQARPINTPLPCGHEVVCSVCRTILLECPVKGCKQPTR